MKIRENNESFGRQGLLFGEIKHQTIHAEENLHLQKNILAMKSFETCFTIINQFETKLGSDYSRQIRC